MVIVTSNGPSPHSSSKDRTRARLPTLWTKPLAMAPTMLSLLSNGNHRTASSSRLSLSSLHTSLRTLYTPSNRLSSTFQEQTHLRRATNTLRHTHHPLPPMEHRLCHGGSMTLALDLLSGEAWGLRIHHSAMLCSRAATLVGCQPKHLFPSLKIWPAMYQVNNSSGRSLPPTTHMLQASHRYMEGLSSNLLHRESLSPCSNRGRLWIIASSKCSKCSNSNISLYQPSIKHLCLILISK